MVFWVFFFMLVAGDGARGDVTVSAVGFETSEECRRGREEVTSEASAAGRAVQVSECQEVRMRTPERGR